MSPDTTTLPLSRR